MVAEPIWSSKFSVKSYWTDFFTTKQSDVDKTPFLFFLAKQTNNENCY